MTITKFYTVIEVNKDLNTNEDCIDTESFKTRAEAEQVVEDSYNEVVSALNEEYREINLQSNQDNEIADIETDTERWHWEIQTQTIAD